MTCCSRPSTWRVTLKIDPEGLPPKKTRNKVCQPLCGDGDVRRLPAKTKLADLSLSELDALWDSAKHEEHRIRSKTMKKANW